MFVHALVRSLKWWAMLLLATLVAAPGCGQKNTNPELAPTFGEITLDGQPLAHSYVMFAHPTKGTSYGMTDGSGRYQMEFSQTQSGAFIGENKVYLSTQDVDLPDGSTQMNELIPTHYREGRSELIIDVKAEGAPYDLALDSNPPPAAKRSSARR
ncbi:MAG: hypothetical protein ACIALR_01405 [Blastopirellula sp. JB062]